MSEQKMMKCGHAANAVDKDGNPVCVICMGTHDGWNQVDETPPDLTGRTMRCAYYSSCKHERPSSVDGAFFEHLPDKEHDKYYCGCMGWD